MVLRAGFHGTVGQPSAQVIDGSLKINQTLTQHLSRTPGSEGNRKTLTWSAWVRRTKISGESNIFSVGPSGSTQAAFRFNDDDTLQVRDGGGGELTTSAKFRDTGWYHIVVKIDNTQSTAADRFRLYVNGSETIYGASSYANQGTDTDWNQTEPHYIGRQVHNTSNLFDGLLCQNYFIDGYALDPDQFGFTDPLTNTWRPKAYITNLGTIVNNGIVWSDSWDGTGSTGTVDNSARAFNGDLTNYTSNQNSNTICNWVPSSPIPVKRSLRVYAAAISSGADQVYVNGTSLGTISGSTPQWFSIQATQLTSVGVQDIGATHGRLYAVEVDGVILVDSSTSNSTDATYPFGTNGFYLPMDNQDDFEIDKSGNGNNWTQNNFSGTSVDPDVLKDSPSGAVFGGRAQTGITTTSSAPGNYCTYNPFDRRANTALSNGNLTVTGYNADWYLARCTQFLSTGKYYWEFKWYGGAVTGSSGYQMGLKTPESTLSAAASQAGSFAFQYTTIYETDGTINSVVISPGSTTAGDTVMFAYDADAGLMWFGVNGTWNDNADPATGTNSDWTSLPTTGLAPFAGTYNTTIKIDANFGQKPFKYAPPQGFLPVNSASATPETVIARPDQYVGITTWSGNNVDGREIDMGMAPDLIWVKARNQTNWPWLTDTVRGAPNKLYSNDTTAQDTAPIYGQADSFTYKGWIAGGGTDGSNPLSDSNQTGTNYVCWAWRAGGNKGTFNVDDVGYASAAAAGLTGGTITPSGASVGTKQGFSIIKYDGDGNDATIPHGLLQTPTFIIKKFMGGTSSWDAWTPSLSSNKRMTLNTSDEESATTSYQSVNATTFDVHAGNNDDGVSMIAYLWHDVPGLQKFGSYAGIDGAPLYVHLGFRPALLVIKFYTGTDVGSHAGWKVIDNQRNKFNPSGIAQKLAWDVNEVENGGTTISTTEGKVDFLSNGFRIIDGHAPFKSAGRSYIYMAWAEAPAINLYGGQSNAR